jgi:misacylated tRNA(Ala) deacylase
MSTELLFRADPYARACEAAVVAAGEGWVQLDRTVFYPTGGGQPGDRGRLVREEGALCPIEEAIKGDGETVIHRVAGGGALPPAGTRLTAEIDWARRHRLMRMHSALHLLCAAVAEAVTGGQVGEERGRLDFDVQGSGLDKEAIAARIAAWVADDRPIRETWIEAGELERRPELVRTLSVKPPRTGGRIRLIEIEGVDLQACGGTHVRSTGEIGLLRIGKIENKGRQNRRVHLAFAE